MTDSQESLFPQKPAKSFLSAAPAITANIDGGARGNPGPAAYGVVIRNAKGEVIAELSEYVGLQTNNFAEYSALLAALEFAVRKNHPSLKVVSDSELMVRQMNGQYKVSNPVLRELYARAQSLVRKLENFSITHVLREKNKDADRLVNKVLDERARR
jgi:probable phosphoglycerate mutase